MPTKRSRPPVYDREAALTLADGQTVTAEFTIEMRAFAEWIGFGDGDECGSVIRRRFTLTIDRDALTGALGDGDSPAPEAWLAQLAPYALSYAPTVLTADRLLIAELRSEEYPVMQLEAAARGRWFDWTDANGNEQIGWLAAHWERTPRDSERAGLFLPLLDGSLHWLRTLGVHPAFRGRCLGLGLLHHALWSMHRATGDLAFLEARPYATLFDPDAIEPTQEGVRALVRHYARIGFRRSIPRKPITHAETLMHLQLDACERPQARDYATGAEHP